MSIWARLAEDRTDLTAVEREELGTIVGEWSLIADLGLGDLVLWLPTWNEAGLIAVALVRPTTAPTSVPEDIVGTFAPKGRFPELDQALAFGRVVAHAYPIRSAGRVIAVIARHPSAAARVVGQLEEIYLRTADDLLQMLVAGTFPSKALSDSGLESPRVGDGLIRLDGEGRAQYASPNAVSALRRLGLATGVVGNDFASIAIRLSHRQGPVDEGLSAIARGRLAGQVDLENAQATVLLRGIPLLVDGGVVGALVLLRDVTDLRRRERALLSKEATIREIHHRVKNNLQTVAALLRLQARRATSEQTRAALGEAELRVGAIALVHETLSRQAGEAVLFDEVADRIIALVRDLAPGHTTGEAIPSITRRGSSGECGGDVATALAMCLSELLHNAIEHAGATSIVVELDHSPLEATVAVLDDGVGLPEGFHGTDSGLGLQIVKSLATGELRGRFTLQGEPGRGTRAEVRVGRADAGH